MLTKMVDGIEVTCSAEEEAAIQAEWKANEEQKQAAIAVKADLASTLDTAIQTGDTEAALLAIKQMLTKA